MSFFLRYFNHLIRDPKKRLEFLLGVTLLIFISLLTASGGLNAFEQLFLDLHFQIRGTQAFRSPVVMVGIDEPSLDVFGRWPWRRDIHASLIDILRHESFRPNVMAFDLLFENKNTAELAGDEALVFQAKNMEERVMMAYFFEKGMVAYPPLPELQKRLEAFAIPSALGDVPEHLDEANKASLPFPALSATTQLAFVNTPVDTDGRSRRAQLLMRFEGKVYPSMDLLIALKMLGASISDIKLERRAIVISPDRSEHRVIPINDRGEMLIWFYGKEKVIPAYSFVQLLKEGKRWMQGGSSELLRELKGKALIVGATALGLGDRRVTPFHQYETGLSLHAQAVANILENQFLRQAPAWVSLWILIFFGVITMMLTMTWPVNRALPAVLGLAVIHFALAQFLFVRGVWVDAAGPLLGFVTIFIGITSLRYFAALEELKRTQEQLIQSAKMASLGELSAGIAHEFRNILNAINLNVECCLHPGVTAEKLQNYADMFRRIMRSANMILEGLLAFSRKSELVKKPGFLKKTIEDTLLLVGKDLMRYQIEVKPELEDVPEMVYDAGQISQVIMNLMNNGRDALRDREKKEIRVRLKNTVKGILIEIEDNGSGIPPQVLKRLFEPFVTSKPVGKGTGLGLSVCHGIIRAHGGDITVTTAQGKGTTWHILFPK